MRTTTIVFLLAMVSLLRAVRGDISIINSPHNLSASGPGVIRAGTEQQLCIFCHAPHFTARVQPLWNRNIPAGNYTIYKSNALKAVVGQPTGSSKLCLSCHDGTIALGSVLSRSQPIQMANGITTLPIGATNLGTDLSDDHPVSFIYDAALVTRNPKLKSPSLLTATTPLDASGQMQCTTCHSAHDNTNGNFLVMNNSASQLCNTCHQQGVTDISAHTQCNACHQPHSAPSKSYLLKGATVTATCLPCHSGASGTNQGPNIYTDLQKLQHHDTNSPVDQANHIPSNVACNDCHEGHTMRNLTAVAPAISPKMGSIDGINAAGSVVTVAQYQYEVCFKCHDNQAATNPRVSRQIVQNNTRLEFSTSSISYHPVEGQGKGTDVPSLIAPLTIASIIYCTDCHASETSKKAGGSGANGPHGSGIRPILIARYDTADRTSESASTYALCYRCHNRSSILNDNSFNKHHTHITDQRTPCSVCHDAHGISQTQGVATKNAHLINFDTSVVTPSSSGRLEYNRTGTRHGNCYLRCHGTNHNPYSY